MTWLRVLVASTLIVGVGCRQQDIVADRPDCDGSECAPLDAGVGCPARPPPPGSGTEAERRQRWFGRGLCACGEISLSAPARFDSFDSRQGPYDPLGPGGPDGQSGGIGLNGGLTTSGRLEVEGDAVVGENLQGGAEPLTFGSLRVGGSVAVDGALTVGGDAEVAGALRASELRVDGQLTQPPGATRTVGIEMIDERITGSVMVAPPCDCDNLPNLSAIVNAQTESGGGLDLSLAGLTNIDDPTTVDLPCGVYLFSAISGSSDLRLRISGPTQLYVAGSLSLGAFDIEMAPGATVDLFIAGGWVTDGTSMIGDPTQPDAVRLYIGTPGTLNLAGGATWFGLVVAPNADLVTAGDLEVHGSLFLRRLSGSGAVELHYDRRLR